MLDLRAVILAADDLVKVPITLPAWTDAPLFVRTMSGAERDTFEASILDKTGQTLSNIRAKLAVRTLVDENGNRIFTDADAAALGDKSAAELQKVFNVARKLNKLSNDDVDELVKNSNGDPSADSTSASPSPSGEPSVNS
jgi:hypothetical protein